MDCGALAIEVSGKGSRSTNTYRLEGHATGWAVSNDSQSHELRHTVARVTTHSRREPYSEPYNEPYSLQVEKSEVENSEEPDTSDSTESTATPSRVNGEPAKARKPRKTTPKVKAEPSVSESFKTEMIEKYPGMDVAAEIDSALNHTAVTKYGEHRAICGELAQTLGRVGQRAQVFNPIDTPCDQD